MGPECDEDVRIFFFNDTATTEIYTLSLHDALPIFRTSVHWAWWRVRVALLGARCSEGKEEQHGGGKRGFGSSVPHGYLSGGNPGRSRQDTKPCLVWHGRFSPGEDQRGPEPTKQVASGGIVSRPADLNSFIRGYVGGRLFGSKTSSQQRQVVEGGSSEPPGPGINAAGSRSCATRRAAGRYGATRGTPPATPS